MLNITPNFKIKNLILGLAAVAVSMTTTAQEAGDVNWKQWNVSIPVDSGGGLPTLLEGKAAKKGASNPEFKKYYRQNSNSTFELKTTFNGVTQDGEYGFNQGKYSSSEFVEVFNKNKKNYWPNTVSYTHLTLPTTPYV